MQFKLLKGTKGIYRINKSGEVLREKPNGITVIANVQGTGSKNYDTVRLDSKNKYIHRLVAETFLPNPLGYKVVHHKDHNHYNNHVDNLEWIENQAKHRESHGKNKSKFTTIAIPRTLAERFRTMKGSRSATQYIEYLLSLDEEC